MKRYRYTSDIYGSEAFEFDSLADFQAALNGLFEAVEWGDAPQLQADDGIIYVLDRLGNHIEVGEVYDHAPLQGYLLLTPAAVLDNEAMQQFNAPQTVLKLTFETVEETQAALDKTKPEHVIAAYYGRDLERESE